MVDVIFGWWQRQRENGVFWTGLLFCGAGLFCVAGSVFGWEWFLNHRKAKRLADAITPTGARIFYGLIGCIAIVFGVLIITGVIKG